jgi:uncharacterized protein (DUF736 family)
MKRIGAFWKGKPDSKAVLTGSIDLLGADIRVCVCKNDKKEKENEPDYYILRMEERKPQQPQQSGDQPPQENLPF